MLFPERCKKRIAVTLSELSFARPRAMTSCCERGPDIFRCIDHVTRRNCMDICGFRRYRYAILQVRMKTLLKMNILALT
jgi:hypothetical protein